MRDKADDIVSGIRLMLISTGAKVAKVGIEDNKPEAIATMRKAVAGFAELLLCRCLPVTRWARIAS